MIPAQPTPPGQPGALAPDERLRQQGAKLVMAISSTLRVGRAYAVQNQVFLNQLAGLLEAVQPVLQQQGEAVLVAHDSDLYMNGVRVPVNQASFKFQQTVLELFARLKVAGLRFQTGVTAPELGRLFELLVKLDGPVGSELIGSATAHGLAAALPVLNATVGGLPGE